MAHGAKQSSSCTHTFFRREEGSATVFNILWLIPLIAVGGLAIDAAIGYAWKARLQAAADAAAHAAVMELGDVDAAKDKAIEFAGKNINPDAFGAVLAEDDVETGNWNQTTRTFTPNGSPLDAVRVTTRRDATNDNQVSTTFLRFTGLAGWDVIAVAVAEADSNNCFENGFVAGGKIWSGSQNQYINDFCLHGEDGVEIGSQNIIEDGVVISMPNLRDFVQGSDNGDSDDFLSQANNPPSLPQQIDTLIDGLEDGSIDPQLTDFETFDSIEEVSSVSISDLRTRGKYYIVNDVVDFGSSNTFEDLVVISDEEIKVGSGVTLINVLLASRDKVTFGSENTFGAANFCTNNRRDGVRIFSSYDDTDAVKFGSQSNFYGVQIAGTGEVNLGSELGSVTGLGVQAGKDIHYGSQEIYGACGIDPLLLSSDEVIRLVD